MLDTPLRNREMMLKATRSKVSLICMTCNELLSHFTKQKCQNALTVAGWENILVQTKLGVRLQRRYMTTYNEEANVIMAQQEEKAKEEGYCHGKWCVMILMCLVLCVVCIVVCKKDGRKSYSWIH